MVAGFAASRLLAWHLGVRFDAAPLDYFWQYLDPTLLRSDLARSLLHLHSQPPGFNALLGIVLKLPGDSSLAFAWLYRAIGLATALGLFGVLVKLGAEPRRAGLGVVIFAASPTAVLYESWLFYTHVVAALLVASAWLAHALVRHGRVRDAVLLAGAGAALACTRSLFHLAWLSAVLAGALWLVRRQQPARRTGKLALAMVPALLLVVSVHAKNAIVFGSPASSTWLGMSLAKLTTQRLDPAVRARLVGDGELSRAALVKPFSPLWKYPPELTKTSYHGHPALDRIVKPGNYTNFNNGAYVELNRLYLQDALYTIRHFPGVYLAGVGRGLLLYGIPPSQYRFLRANQAAYRPVDRVFEWLTGVPEAFTGARHPEALGDPVYLLRRIRWLYLAVLVASMGWALVRCRRLPADPDSDAERGVLLFCLASALWVGVVANALELGENQRFHAMVAPLHFLLIGWMLERAVQRWQARRRAARGAGAAQAVAPAPAASSPPACRTFSARAPRGPSWTTYSTLSPSDRAS